MKDLVFKKVFFRGEAGKLALSQKDGSATRRLNFAMEWNASVRKAFGWRETDDKEEQVKLSGEMAIHQMKYTVGGFDFDFGSGIMADFVLHRLTDEKEKVRFELRCQYATMTRGVLRWVEECAEANARLKGELAVTYEMADPEPKEGETGKDGKPKAGKQATLVEITQ